MHQYLRESYGPQCSITVLYRIVYICSSYSRSKTLAVKLLIIFNIVFYSNIFVEFLIEIHIIVGRCSRIINKALQLCFDIFENYTHVVLCTTIFD